MTKRLYLLLLPLAIAVPLEAQIKTIVPGHRYTSFETSSFPTNLTTTQATATRSSSYSTDGNSSLQVVMSANQPFPGFRFTMSPNIDWSSSSGVAIDVYNPQTTAVTLFSRIDDPGDTVTGSVSLPPQSETTVVFAFAAPYAPSVGMKSGPLLPGYGVMTNRSGPIAATSVSGLLFFAPTTKGPSLTLYFDNLRTIDGYAGMNGRQSAISLLYGSMVDRFGQFTKSTWPGKVMQEADLKNSDAPLPIPPIDRDLYGGAKTLTGYGTTNYFHTTKSANGNWWFVDPLGNLFFSLGVDTVARSNRNFVGVDNNIAPQPAARYSWFTSLPGPADPLAIHYGKDFVEKSFCNLNTDNIGCSFDFSNANLQLKFGTANFSAAFQTEALSRLRSWGFNTIGDFSDPTLALASDSSGFHVPYTIKVGFNRSSYLSVTVPVGGSPQIADPFDPNFGRAIAKGVSQSVTKTTISDPYLLGYFVDNEMPWSSGTFPTKANPNGDEDARYFPLIYGVIKSPPTQPAKVFWEQSLLMPKYPTIDNLNASWGTRYQSWPDFLANTTVPPMTTATRTDFSAFLLLYAQKYYKVVSQEIHTVDPNHLYLGSKLSSFTPEIVKACGNYCDVISFDIYATSVPTSAWAAVIGPANKPAIIAEFQFGSTDAGAFYGGLVPNIPNQAARGAAYSTYVQSVYANPFFIGAHWYQYQDQPLTGRLSDGENWGIGLTAITDRVYPELTSAATITNSHAYNTANGGRTTR